MTTADVITIALSLGCPQADANLIASFAVVESSCNPNAIGDDGMARGLYQFHAARWKESGGRAEDYGDIGARGQIIVMRTALARYRAAAHRKRLQGRAFENYVYTCHNGIPKKYKGGETAYTKRIRKALAAIEKETAR